MRVEGFYIQTFQANVWIAATCEPEELAAMIRDDLGVEWSEDKPTWAAKCVEVEKPTGGTVIIIALRAEWTGHRDQYANLAHEAFHAAEYICERAQIPHGEATSEVFAYLTGSIVRRCAALLDSHRDGERGEWMRHKARRIEAYFNGFGPHGAGGVVSS